MSEKEMRELDAFVANHVMGWKILPSGYFETSHGDIHGLANWAPTYNSEQAIDVLKKCAEKSGKIIISRFLNDWIIGIDQGGRALGKSESLELSICLAAKELFSK